MSVFVKIFDGSLCCFDLNTLQYDPVNLLNRVVRNKNLCSQDVRLMHNGKFVCEKDRLVENGMYYALLGLEGGKGGFGAMLRMIGAQIEKTTNREACRDLSGRRMRDVNNEKKLQDWIEKKKQQEEERERKRREKLERMRSQPRHFFVDPKYDKQKEAVAESLEDAVSKGIEVGGPSSNGAATASSVKRKAEDGDSDPDDDTDFKRHCMWLGVDHDDDDEEENDAEDEVLKQRITAAQSSAPSTISSCPPDEQQSDVERTEMSPGQAQSSSSEPSSDEVSPSRKKCLLSVLPPPSSGKCDKTVPESTKDETGPVNLDDFSSAAELEELGLDRLKTALMARGMKCGGTLQERAGRLYSVKGLELSEIDPSLLAKPAKGKKGKK